MNEEGNKKIIIPLIVLSILLFGVIVITIIVNNQRKEKPITIDYTTTPIKDNNENLNVDAKPVVVTNFQESLDNIDSLGILKGIESKQINYSGAIFNFKCSSYNDDTCSSGSLTMNVGTTMLPIYTFNYAEENYGMHSEDIFIGVNDQYILIAYNSEPIRMKVYSRTGNFINEFNDGLFYYYLGNEKIGPSYPSLSEKITYYTCSDNNIYLKSITPTNMDDVSLNVKIEGANCK